MRIPAACLLCALAVACGSGKREVEAPVCIPAKVAVDPPALAPASAPAAIDTACSEDLSWLREAERVEIRSFETGHWGMSGVYADLMSWSSTETFGLVTATYQRRPGRKIETEAREVHVDTPDMRAMLDAFQRAASAREAPSPTGRHINIGDTSRTLRIAVDVFARVHRATFESDDAQDDPPSWHVRGCAHAFAYQAQAPLMKSFRDFEVLLGVSALLDAAKSRAPP